MLSACRRRAPKELSQFATNVQCFASLGYEALGSDPGSLHGKTVLVTGSTDGIGRHTAALLAQQGATVLVHGRNRTRVQRTLRDLRAHTGSARVYGYGYDLSSLQQTRAFGEHLLRDLQQHFGGSLAVLCNNAAVFNEERRETEDALEETWAVNVAAPFLLTSLLVDRVTERVVNLGSISHSDSLEWEDLQGERQYGRVGHQAYSRSKLAVAMWTFRLAARLRRARHPAVAHCIDPGATATKILLAGWGEVAHGVACRAAEATDLEWAVRDAGLAKCTGKFWVNRKPRTATRAAYSVEAQQRLWDLLCEQTGARWPV